MSHFTFICRHLGSYIFPVPVKANSTTEARMLFEVANNLVNKQVRPMYVFEAHGPCASETSGTCLDSWLGSVPFQTFDEGLVNWLSLERWGDIDKHAHHIVQLERIRVGERVISKTRNGRETIVINWTEQALLDLLSEEVVKLERPTGAQVFSEAIGYAFDFQTVLQKCIDEKCVFERKMHAKGQAAIAASGGRGVKRKKQQEQAT